jgi:Tfp pilus assembly protein PilN
MPLRLNLYHEIERNRSASRRDPLKISLYVIGGIAASFAVWYLWEFAKLTRLGHELAKTKVEFAQLDPKAKEAKKKEEDLSRTFKTSEKLIAKLEGRFYWAPVLERLMTLVPREVQITKFSGDTQGESYKKCQFTIDGLSAGTDPRKVAEELRQSLAETFAKDYKTVEAKFRTLEDGTETAMLDGQLQPTASFAINVQFHSGEPPSTPAPNNVADRRRKK